MGIPSSYLSSNILRVYPQFVPGDDHYKNPFDLVIRAKFSLAVCSLALSVDPLHDADCNIRLLTSKYTSKRMIRKEQSIATCSLPPQKQADDYTRPREPQVMLVQYVRVLATTCHSEHMPIFRISSRMN